MSENSIGFGYALLETLQDEIREKDAEIERLRAAFVWTALRHDVQQGRPGTMTDIVERLRERECKFCDEAAAEIKRLRADVSARTKNLRLQSCLSVACRQWKMYADLQEGRDLSTEQSVEGTLYHKCLAAAGDVQP